MTNEVLRVEMKKYVFLWLGYLLAMVLHANRIR
jgi:hypothetical protein